MGQRQERGADAEHRAHLLGALRRNELATAGPYEHVRHPQYVAFVMILFGFLLQWPTLLTLVMFPVLVWMYGRLSTSEGAEMRQRFGATYEQWAARTPRFLSTWRNRRAMG